MNAYVKNAPHPFLLQVQKLLTASGEKKTGTFLVACLCILFRAAPAGEAAVAMERSFFDGVFAGDVSPAVSPVKETIMMHDGRFPDGCPSSYWSRYKFKNIRPGISEKDVFHCLPRHFDTDGKKNWAIGIGKGGQLYSWRGPRGEAVAPQAAPWMDELWQARLHSPQAAQLLRAIRPYDKTENSFTGKSLWVRYDLMAGTMEYAGKKGSEPASRADYDALDRPEAQATLHSRYPRTLADVTRSLSRDAIVTTNPCGLSRAKAYRNPLPDDHELNGGLKNTVKFYTHQSDAGKVLKRDLPGFVMPVGKAGLEQGKYVLAFTIVDATEKTEDVLLRKQGS